jgi:hypothetical protein
MVLGVQCVSVGVRVWRRAALATVVAAGAAIPDAPGSRAPDHHCRLRTVRECRPSSTAVLSVWVEFTNGLLAVKRPARGK